MYSMCLAPIAIPRINNLFIYKFYNLYEYPETMDFYITVAITEHLACKVPTIPLSNTNTLLFPSL